MVQVIILGSASAVPTEESENTHFLVQASNRVVLVDCPGSPVVRLEKAGIDPQSLTDIILTHFHPDHVSGLASLLMSLWLLGRKQPVNIYGLAVTVERARQMMDLFDWQDWPGFYSVNFFSIPSEALAPVIDTPGLRVYASPVQHLIPTMGLRMEFSSPSKSFAYSCDTEPSPAVERLAHGVDVLLHEATGDSKGHTSPKQAGEVAQRAGAKSLYLIHYPPQTKDPEQLLDAARKTFSGPVYLTKDFMKIDLE